MTAVPPLTYSASSSTCTGESERGIRSDGESALSLSGLLPLLLCNHPLCPRDAADPQDTQGAGATGTTHTRTQPPREPPPHAHTSDEPRRAAACACLAMAAISPVTRASPEPPDPCGRVCSVSLGGTGAMG